MFAGLPRRFEVDLLAELLVRLLASGALRPVCRPKILRELDAHVLVVAVALVLDRLVDVDRVDETQAAAQIEAGDEPERHVVLDVWRAREISAAHPSKRRPEREERRAHDARDQRRSAAATKVDDVERRDTPQSASIAEHDHRPERVDPSRDRLRRQRQSAADQSATRRPRVSVAPEQQPRHRAPNTLENDADTDALRPRRGLVHARSLFLLGRGGGLGRVLAEQAAFQNSTFTPVQLRPWRSDRPSRSSFPTSPLWVSTRSPFLSAGDGCRLLLLLRRVDQNMRSKSGTRSSSGNNIAKTARSLRRRPALRPQAATVAAARRAAQALPVDPAPEERLEMKTSVPQGGYLRGRSSGRGLARIVEVSKRTSLLFDGGLTPRAPGSNWTDP